MPAVQALALENLCMASADSLLPRTAGGVLKKGEKLFLEQKVDPSLIGGFVIDIGAPFYSRLIACPLTCKQAAMSRCPDLAAVAIVSSVLLASPAVPDSLQVVHVFSWATE